MRRFAFTLLTLQASTLAAALASVTGGCFDHPTFSGGVPGATSPDDTGPVVPSEPAEELDCSHATGPYAGFGDVVVEWHWTELAANHWYRNVFVLPVVGSVDDDNGDGVLDGRDQPEVAFTAFCHTGRASDEECPSYAHLVLLDGATGSEVWSQGGFHGDGGVSLVDLDRDGSGEILAFDEDGIMHAVLADGSDAWTSTDQDGTTYPMPTVADLDADGVPEIATGTSILDGASGATEASLVGIEGLYRQPMLADLDLDGTMEVVVSDRVFDPTGSLLWLAPITATRPYAAPVQYDSDAEAEVVFVGDTQLVLTDHTGLTLASATLPVDVDHPPCVADFDGDGESEVAVGARDGLWVGEVDGTTLWTTSFPGWCGVPSCSAFDFDDDGAYELLYTSSGEFAIFDGATGAEHYRLTGLGAASGYGYPVVADIDQDCSAEILLVGNDYWVDGETGVLALGEASDGWPQGGAAWPVHDFAVTSFGSNLQPTAPPSPTWTEHGLYRGRPATP